MTKRRRELFALGRRNKLGCHAPVLDGVPLALQSRIIVFGALIHTIPLFIFDVYKAARIDSVSELATIIVRSA